MKKNILKLLFIVPAFILACDGDDEASVSVDFATLSSSYYEKDGAGSLTIPFRNASAGKNLEVAFGGTATQGEDFELVGITAEGVQLSIKDDTKFEKNETIRIQLRSSGKNVAGNAIHTVTIVSNCADTDELDADFFEGVFDATEIYAPDDIYGPYELEIEQDETDPNKYWMHDFWDSDLNAYIVYNPATKTVSFPQQIPVATFPLRIITSDPAIITNNCNFKIVTHYRGSTWEYEFVKHQFTKD